MIMDMDKGSLEEFNTLVDQEISMRIEYDTCMNEHYFYKILDGKPLLDLNKTDFIKLLRVGSNSKTYLKLKGSLKYCFGSSMVRSSKLGMRHVDKGVYVDQLYRWFINFDSQNVLIELIDSWTDRNNVISNSFLSSFRRILRFMNVQSGIDEMIRRLQQQQERRLLSPNRIWRNIRAIVDNFTETDINYRPSDSVNDGNDRNDEKRIMQLYLTIEKKLADFYRPYNKLLARLMQVCVE